MVCSFGSKLGNVNCYKPYLIAALQVLKNRLTKEETSSQIELGVHAFSVVFKNAHSPMFL